MIELTSWKRNQCIELEIENCRKSTTGKGCNSILPLWETIIISVRDTWTNEISRPRIRFIGAQRDPIESILFIYWLVFSEQQSAWYRFISLSRCWYPFAKRVIFCNWKQVISQSCEPTFLNLLGFAMKLHNKSPLQRIQFHFEITTRIISIFLFAEFMSTRSDLWTT